jgi:MFS family permease
MQNNRWTIFGICSSLFLMSMLYRASSAVIAGNLSLDLGLTPQDLGLLGATFFYASGLAQFPLGFVLDRIGAKRTVAVLNMIGVTGAFVFAGAHGLTGGLVGRALLGVGMSANMLGSLVLFTKWFKLNEFGTLSGILVSVGSLGSLLATSPLVLLTSWIGWRGSFYFLGVLNLLFALGLMVLVKETPPVAPAMAMVAVRPAPRPAIREFMVLFRDGSYWAIALTAGLRYGVFAAIQTLWAGPFLLIYLGFPELTAGNLLLVLSIGSMAGAPLGGFLSDRVFKSRKRTVLAGLVTMMVLVFILAHWPGAVHLELLYLLMFMMGFVGAFGQVVYAHIKELMPEEMAGRAMASINFFVFAGAGVFLHGLGSVLGSGGLGGLAEGSAFVSAFMWCVAALFVATVLYCFSRDVKVRD